MHTAVENHRIDAVRYLLSLGAEINAENAQGMTPLHTAVRVGNLRSTKDLLLRGADRNIKARDGKTAVEMID